MDRKKPSTLSEWQDVFDAIYGDQNQCLDLDVIWLHVVEEVGEVAKDLRMEKHERLKVDLPDVFAWLCAFSQRAGRRLEDAVWAKYPRVCPYCLRAQRCVCIGGSYPSYEPARLQAYRKMNKKPTSFSEWEEMFRSIYGNVNTIVMTPAIGFHLMEEIGEVAKQLRGASFGEFDEGIADVFAWIVALTMKFPRFGSLSDAVWELYPGVCKICAQQPCICDPQSLIVRG